MLEVEQTAKVLLAKMARWRNAKTITERYAQHLDQTSFVLKQLLNEIDHQRQSNQTIAARWCQLNQDFTALKATAQNAQIETQELTQLFIKHLKNS